MGQIAISDHLRLRVAVAKNARFVAHGLSASCMKAFLIVLLIGAASALRLVPANRLLHTPARRINIALQAADDVRECITDAENAAEIEDCKAPATAHSASAHAAPAIKSTASDRQDHLMGSAESLAECLYEAENAGEVEECRTDFEELIGVPTGTCSEDGKCNPEDIRVKTPTGRSAGGPTMLLCDVLSRKAVPGKCIFRGDRCTGKRCKVNNAPCKVNHASV